MRAALLPQAARASPQIALAAAILRRRRSFHGLNLCPLSLFSTGGIRLVRLILCDSFQMWPRRSTGNGGTLPATARAKRARCPTRQLAGGSEGRAADEAAAMRKLRACPLADAKAAGFVKCPPGFRTPGPEPNRQATGPGSRTVRRKRNFGSRAATGEDRVSARFSSGRTGLRPGSCEKGGPRISVHGPPGDPRLRPRDPPEREPELRPRCPRRWGAGEPRGFPGSASGEPPGLRP